MLCIILHIFSTWLTNTLKTLNHAPVKCQKFVPPKFHSEAAPKRLGPQIPVQPLHKNLCATSAEFTCRLVSGSRNIPYGFQTS